MAYNVLKGPVDGSVDQHGDQDIGGVKVFKNTISASTFYDTDDGRPCVTDSSVALTKLNGSTPNGIVIFQGDKNASTHHNLTFDGKALYTDMVCATAFTGSAGGLRDIPASNLKGTLNSDLIDCGPGLESKKGKLKVKTFRGIFAAENGLSVDLLPNSGLDIKENKLTVAPANCANVKDQGQNIGGRDLLLLYNVASGQLKHSTVDNLYSGFLNTKVPQAAGVKNSVQFRGSKEFEGDAEFTYEPRSNTLDLKGTLRANEIETSKSLQVNGSVEVNGALYAKISKIQDTYYEIKETDYTILAEANKNKSTIVLPPAAENVGRVIVIKRIVEEGNKYKIIGSQPVIIKSDTDMIDFFKELILKSNYSSRTLQSDGENWWIINSRGS